MKRWRAPFTRAVLAARHVLATRGIAAPEEIDLHALLDDYRIKLLRRDIGNAEGRLVRSGRRGVMSIDERAFASEKWRFVLGHELGHFLLHAMRDELSCFPKVDATSDEKSKRWLDEEAASHFGVELIAPAAMVRARDDRGAPVMQRALAIAKVFGVSLPTAALRVLDFTEAPCAVLYVEAGEVKWCTASKSFAVDVPTRVPLPVGSAASSVGRDGHVGRTALDTQVDASVWGEDATGIGVLREHAVGLAPFDAVVAVLEHG
jgi:Zn-dependent peptidase ImmA (M78 family)